MLSGTAGATVLFNVNNYNSSINVEEINSQTSDLKSKPSFNPLSSSTISLIYSFSAPEVYSYGYDRLEMEGMLEILEPGEPKLPFKTAKVLIPPGSNVISVEIKSNMPSYLPGEYKIEPAGEHVPLSYMSNFDFNPDLLEPDENIYGSSEPYPGELSELVGTQRFRGYDIAIVNLYPVQYIPLKGQVYYYTELKLELKYSNSQNFRNSDLISSSGSEYQNFRNMFSDKEAVAELVDNPDEIHSLYQPRSPFLAPQLNASAKWDMVLITNDELNGSTGDYTFSDLVNYRNTHGIKTTIVTVENITADSKYWNTSSARFNDTAAQIRHFIIDAYNNWGITYVLLGGDGDGKDVGGQSGDNIIPGRGFYFTSDPNLPSDLYYACLDGNWNNDGDANWGEYPTECDFFAEVYVGRAPVDNASEVSNFVNKTLHYETTNDSYLDSVLMSGEFLWANPDTWGGDYMEEIRNGSSAHGYTTAGVPEDIYTINYNVSELYDKDWPGNQRWPKSELKKIINNNVHIINHLGHCNTLYAMKLNIADADSFTNTEYFFGYSQGCYPGAFDNRGTSATKYYSTDAIVEHFVAEPNGAFAFVGNSRYGYGMRGSTNGASQYYHRQFVDAIYGEGYFDLGRANHDSKEDNVGYVAGSVLRWCYFETNLFGDPSLELRLPKPEPHDVSVPHMDAPEHVVPNTKLTINATVHNRGYCNESKVKVNFTVDGSVLNSKNISYLAVGASKNVTFNWTPVMGLYDVAVEAEPVPGETLLENNRREQTVIVEPDIAVKNAVYSDKIYLDKQTAIIANVENIGKLSVSNVRVILFVDGVEKYNDTITSLGGGIDTNITLLWTPAAAGDRDVSIFAQNLSNEHSVEDNYYNLTLTVKVHPEIDWTPNKFELTVPQGKEDLYSLKVFNNGTAELYYVHDDYARAGQHRKIALISDLEELENITDTLDELGLTYDIYNNNTLKKYTEKYDTLKSYGLIIFYSASRALTLNEKLALDRYTTENGGNLIITGYDSLGSPTDYRMAYLVRSRYAYDGPWSYNCLISESAHPIISGPFGTLGGKSGFQAANLDHDRALPDTARGSKSVATVSGYSKILVTDSAPPKGAKIVYWNGNRFTQDWDSSDPDLQMMFRNLLVWASDDERVDWLSESPKSGMIDYNKDETFDIVVNTTQLYAGNYYRSIVIANNDTDNWGVIIPVNLTVPAPDHDIAVKDLTAPSKIPMEKTVNINATLSNEGVNTENNIEVKLLLDSVEIDSRTITSLSSLSSTPVGFQFTPNQTVTIDEHEIAVKAAAVPYENGTFNNIDSTTVLVYVQPLMKVEPAALDMKGYYDEIISADVSLTNEGTGFLTANFSTYRYLLEDEFPTTTLDTNIWANKSGSPLIVAWALNEPSGIYSLNLDSKADMVESIIIDLSNATRSYLSFYLEPGGAGFRPRTTAWLYLEYFAKNSTWQTLWEKQGDGTGNGYRLGNITFNYYKLELPEEAFHSNFRFRFRTYGTINGYDDWLIDNVRFESFGFDEWLYTNETSSGATEYGGSENVSLTANLTMLSLGVYHKTLYVHSNNPVEPLKAVPVKLTVLGDLNHIHLSHSIWMGTTDESVTIIATGHDINHHEVGFDRNWSTTDPDGTVVNGYYNPGRTGTWKVYCNNSDDSIYNYTTVSISTGNLAKISITPNPWNGTADSQVSFTATGYDEDDNAMSFEGTWSTTDPLGTISQSGSYRAGKMGSWVVKCTNATKGISGTAVVNVNAPSSLFKIEVTPASHTMTTDDTKQFSAKLLDKYNNELSTLPTWSVTGGGTIDSSGLFTADKVGIWTVKASSSGKEGTASVIVNTGELASIEISPKTAELTVGSSQQFTVTGYDADSNARPAPVSWAAGGGTIDSSGMYRAMKVGEWSVYANISGLSASASVTVTFGAIDRLVVTPSPVTMTAGETIQFTVTAYDAYDNGIDIPSAEWTVPGNVGKAHENNRFYGERAGKWELMATLPGETVIGKCTVVIDPGKLAELIVGPVYTEVTAGSSVKYSVKGYDKYGNEIKDPNVVWVENPAGDMDPDNGFFTAHKIGRWDVVVKGVDEEVSAKATISIQPGPLDKLELSPTTCSLTPGEKEQFDFKAYDAYDNEISTTKLSPTWSCDGGLISDGGLYTAQTAGNWLVTLTCSGKSATAEVEVITGELVKLVVSPEKHTLFVSEQVKYSAIGYDIYDNEINVFGRVTWSASGGGSIDTEGVFTAKDVGDWIITGSVGSVTATTYVAVKPKEVTDSDGDRIPDVWEDDHGLDPNDPNDVTDDPDEDGLDNFGEYMAGTEPYNEDSDGDGLSDSWEVENDLDPLKNTGDDGGEGDPDSDGYTNLVEQEKQSDPLDKNDPGPPESTLGSSSEDKKSDGKNVVPFILLVIIICAVLVVAGTVWKRTRKL